MKTLDLFNTVYERALHEGAVDDLEARYIHGLNMKMLDLLGRADEPAYKKNPAARAALKREFQKVKADRDEYFGIDPSTGSTADGMISSTKGKLDDSMGYGTIVGEETHEFKGAHGKLDVARTPGRTVVTRKEYPDSDKMRTDKFSNKRLKGQGSGSAVKTGAGVSSGQGSMRKRPRLDHDANDAPTYGVDEAGIPGNVPVEKIPGKEDLLKGRGRTYYEAQVQKKNPEQINKDQSETDNFTAGDIQRLERIRDLPTLKAQAKELIKGKPARRMKPEKIAFFYNRVDDLKNPLAIIKMLYDMLLAGEGHKVIGSSNSMSGNSYRQRFGEQELAEYGVDPDAPDPNRYQDEPDDWYDAEDDASDLKSGDYVRDSQDDESGEVFRMQGDPAERRVQILDRDGRGWYIAPDRLTRVNSGDPAVQRWFGKAKGVAEGRAQDSAQKDTGWVAEFVNEINYNTFEVSVTNTKSRESANYIVRPVDMISEGLVTLHIETMDVRDLQTGQTESWTIDDAAPQGDIVWAISSLFVDNRELNKKLWNIVHIHQKKGQGQDMMPGLDQRRTIGQEVNADDWVDSHTKAKDAMTKMKQGVDEAGSPAQQAAIAINMKKHHQKPKSMNEFAPSPEDDSSDVPHQLVTLANRWWNAGDKQPQIANVLRSLGWSIQQVESEDDAVQLQNNQGDVYFISADDFDPEVFESSASGSPAYDKGYEDGVRGKELECPFDYGISDYQQYKDGWHDGHDEFELNEDGKGYKSPTGGLTKKGRDHYNRTTGSNLKAPVTTKPSKLKPGSKATKRRKSFCARMGGVKGPMKKPNGKPTRKALALRKWNCEGVEHLEARLAEQLAEGRMSEIDAQRQDLERMTDREFYAAYGISKQAFQQKYRAVLNPVQQQDVPVKEAGVNPQFINVQATKLLTSAGQKFDNRSAAEILAPLMAQYGLTAQQVDQMIPGGLKKLAGESGIMKEGWSDRDRTPYSVYIKGVKWKEFANDNQARAVMDKLKAKFAADGRDPNTITIAPTDYDKGMDEAWSGKYKKSINCSHPKGFSQKAHCAGKSKTESYEVMEAVCEDCGMCESHGNLNEIKKGQKDSNGVTKCWSGYHAAGTKKSPTTGKSVRNCVKNEEQGMAEGEKHGLYYNVNKRKAAGTSRDASSPKAPTAQAWKDAAKTAKTESVSEDQDSLGVESAIIRRIMVAHIDLLKQFGPQQVMQAAEEVADDVGDVDEIGTSDVSGWVNQVRRLLGAK